MLAKIVKSVRRKIWQHLYPQHYWHMRHYDDRFTLTWRDGRAEACWRGQFAAKSLLPREITRTSSSLAIIASGPSLSGTPARAWQGRDIVCVNGSILWARERNLRPKLYVVTDPGFARRQIELVRMAIASVETVCLTVRCLFELLRQDSALFLGKRLLILDHINQPFGRNLYTHAELAALPKVMIDPSRHYQNRYIVGVSTDLRLGVFAGGTVVLAAAQVGMALGYRDIHFLGLDMKPCGTQGRFYSEGKPEPSFIDRNLDGLILPSFAVLRRYCDAEGIVLCNWSPDSAVPRSIVPAALRDADLAVSAA